MKVRAISMGFFAGSRRRAGEVFDVPEGTRASWFVEVPSGTSAAPADKAKKSKSGPNSQPVALSELGKVKSVGPIDLV